MAGLSSAMWGRFSSSCFNDPYPVHFRNFHAIPVRCSIGMIIPFGAHLNEHRVACSSDRQTVQRVAADRVVRLVP